MLCNLQNALRFKGVSQKELAAVLCVSEAELSLRIAGKRPFAPHEMMRTAELLGFDPTWLFKPLAIRAESGFQRRQIAVLEPIVETRSKKV